MSTVGIIGGSGLYEMKDLHAVEEVQVETPFGKPSDTVVRGRLGDVELLFLPRHGRGHRFAPHEVNYRANVFAMKQLGAEQLIGVSAVGSLRESAHPGDIVLVDQFIDRTRRRPNTFFEDVGLVVHVDFAEPLDQALRTALYDAAKGLGATAHLGGTYVCIEGPQFSSRAESRLFRSWKADVVGMTNLPEAKLAREAELPYATLAMVTDYDCWHESKEVVSVPAVLEVLRRNVDTARRIIRSAVERLPAADQSPAASALQRAIVTAPDKVPPETRRALAPLIGKYLPEE